MANIEVSPDQNTVIVDGLEYEFNELPQFACFNECDLKKFGVPKCAELSNYLCLEAKRIDKKNGCFKLKTIPDHGINK